MVRTAGESQSAPERSGAADAGAIAAASIGAYGRNASLRRIACPGAPAGWIAYRALGPVVVALGDPRLAPAKGPGRGWVVWYGAPPTLPGAPSRRPLGPEAIVRPDRFTLCGRRMARLRSALHVAEREGIEVVETSWPALRDDHRRQAREAERAWRRRHPVRYGFTLSTFEDATADDRPWFLALREDRVEAFVTWLWSSDERGWVLDLMRRVDGGGHGAMDLLVVRGIEAAATRRLEWVSLGVGVEGTGVRAFKEKFRPEWQDRWIVLPGGAVRRAIGLTAVAAAHVLPARSRRRPIRHRSAARGRRARGRRPIARWSLAVASALMLLTFAVPQVHAVGAARAEGVVDELRASPVAARALAAWDHRPHVPGKVPFRPGRRAAVLV